MAILKLGTGEGTLGRVPELESSTSSIAAFAEHWAGVDRDAARVLRILIEPYP